MIFQKVVVVIRHKCCHGVNTEQGVSEDGEGRERGVGNGQSGAELERSDYEMH